MYASICVVWYFYTYSFFAVKGCFFKKILFIYLFIFEIAVQACADFLT